MDKTNSEHISFFLRRKYIHILQARETPLHIGARIRDGEKVVEMLIKSGTDVNVPCDVSNNNKGEGGGRGGGGGGEEGENKYLRSQM